MENMRINVRQAHSDTYNGNPYIAFAGIMTGLLSVILFVDELDAVSFTVVGVLLFSGIYAYILSYAHYNKRKFLPFVIVGEVVVTAILFVFNIQRISEQSVSIMQALVDGRANTQNVTYVVFVSSVVLIYIIYLLERKSTDDKRGSGVDRMQSKRNQRAWFTSYVSGRGCCSSCRRTLYGRK